MYANAGINDLPRVLWFTIKGFSKNTEETMQFLRNTHLNPCYFAMKCDYYGRWLKVSWGKSNRLDDTSTTRTSAGRDKFWPMTLPKCPWWRPLQNISARRERRFRGTITEKNAHTKALSFQMENSEYPFQSSFKKPSNLTIWTVVQDVFEKPASVKQL